MTTLDELERLSKEASRGGWTCKEMAYNLFLVKNGEGTICDVATWSYGEQVARYTRAHAELIVLMRNNIDALIAVVRAAEVVLGECNMRHLEIFGIPELEAALEKLK